MKTFALDNKSQTLQYMIKDEDGVFMDEKTNNIKNKNEQAELMGVKTPKDGDLGNYSSKTCGNFTKDAVSSFEWKLVKKDKKNNETQ
jgi:hypothetical protein